jgi:putative tricarboxylic transport membrane protein
MATESQDTPEPLQDTRSAFSTKTAELAVAGLFFLGGAIIIFDSLRLGASWAEDGPQTGYFPFYLGVIICLSSLINAARGLTLGGPRNRPFVEVGQLRLVLSVLIPSAVFVGAVGWLGIYVSSIVYIAVFMRWLGKYAWWKLILVAFGVSITFYLIFEIWFKVPLPKGPIEAWLGLD